MFSERMNNKGNQHQGNNDNSWGGQHVRKSYDNYNNYSNNRGEYQQHDGGNRIEQRMQNMRLDSGSNSSGGGSKTAAAEHKESGPKKMTWATIASQPAKPQITTSTSTIKKKGFGPPPPMIPGKHNMELTDGWDTPKNGPLVPPTPAVIQPPQPELVEKQNNSNYEGQPAWPTPGQAQNQNQAPAGGHAASPPQHQSSQQHHQNNQNNQRGNGERSGGGGGYHQMNNNNNNNNQNNYREHSGRQYNQNSSSDRPHQQYNSSHHYNDFQKPYHQHPHQMPTAPPQNHHQSSAPITRSMQPPAPVAAPVVAPVSTSFSGSDNEDSILEQLRVKNQYNPSELDLSQVDNARFFVIKSYSEDDIHRSIKYEIWCSTEHGNKRLDQAFREREKDTGVIYLFFSVNSSGHFCGVAQMITPVDYNSNSSVWSQDKWKGSFRVKWIYVKDVPNTQLRHIRLENNENKPVTNSRDTQEVPNGHGIQMMKIIHGFKHTTSIFDDFTHYEKRQEEEDTHKHESDSYQKPMTLPPSHHSTHNRENMNRQQQYDNGGGRSFDRDRDYNGSGGGGFERGGFNNGSGGGGYNKYGNNSGYNNDYKPSFNNGRGGFQKRNDFRNDRNGDQQSGGGGFYRAKPEYQQNDDFGGNRGGYRSERGNGTRGGRGGSFRPPLNHNN